MLSCSSIEAARPFKHTSVLVKGIPVPAESFISDVRHGGVKETVVIPLRTSRRYFNSCLTRGGSSLLPSLSQGNYCAASETHTAEETLKTSKRFIFLVSYQPSR